jgi:hypothetical protein
MCAEFLYNLPDGDCRLLPVAVAKLLFVMSLSHRTLHHFEVVLSGRILSLDLLRLIVL